MKILVLGGTQMLGRDFVERLFLEKDHSIFIANRGITNPYLFDKDKYTQLKIDRNNINSCLSLRDYTFDIVVDFSCYNIEQFKNTYANLNYHKYIYISTMSVYEEDTIKNPNLNNDYHKYCINKFNIEVFIKNYKIKNCLTIRPCAIYGENDYTNRFYKLNDKFYWKSNNQEVGIGTMYVKDFTNYLLTHFHKYPEIGFIDVCNKWW